MKDTRLPEFLKSALWSYDVSKMDTEEHRALIITQVINYGDKRQLDWMIGHYSDAEIKEVVTHPARGVWWRERLRFWLDKYGVMIDPLRYELAVRENGPRPVSLMTEFFRRVDEDKHESARAYS